MAKNKNRPNKPNQSVTIATEKVPLVSVIIPMFNSAKYVSQTMETLLYQTMKDFEVIIVDDCSTDNSIEVVKSFANRFGGGAYLHVIKLPKHSGAPGVPRNLGVQFARGKYITFLDSDDLFTRTALEELTTLAEQYQPDVLHSNQFFRLWRGEKKSPDDPAFTDFSELINPANFVVWYNYRSRYDKPTFMTEDLAERVKIFLQDDITRETHAALYRRDFLITNQIFFSDLPSQSDEVYTFQIVCRAKKFLRVPNLCYIVRARVGSVIREELAPHKEIHKSLRVNIDGFHALEKVMDDIKFFSEHPDYRYAVLDWFVQGKIYRLAEVYAKIHPAAIAPLVAKEFNLGDENFSAYLFNTMNILWHRAMRLQTELNNLRKQ